MSRGTEIVIRSSFVAVLPCVIGFNNLIDKFIGSYHFRLPLMIASSHARFEMTAEMRDRLIRLK